MDTPCSLSSPADRFPSAMIFLRTVVIALLLVISVLLGPAHAQTAATSDERDPAATPDSSQPTPVRYWQTSIDGGEVVVVRGYTRRGNRHVVLLPDGRMAERRDQDLQPTDRPFRPWSARKIAKRLEAKFPKMQVDVTSRYVFVGNTSETFRRVTQRVLTTMLPGIRKFARKWKLPARSPEFPLVVLMFRTRAEFDQYRRMPANILAYYDAWTNYIVLYEETRMFGTNPEIAVGQTISTIAHEGAHQILHNIGVQQRLSRWPMWIAEGLAEYLAPTKLGRKLSWKGAGLVNDLRMLELEFYVKAKAFDSPPGEMIAHTVQGAQLTSTGYATAWALTHYLANKEKAAFRAILRELTQLGPWQRLGTPNSEGLIEAQLTSFRQHVPTPLKKLEADLITYLDELPYTDPFASAPHYVALITLQRDKETGWKANIFHTEMQARRWSAQFIRQLDDDIQRHVEIVQVPNRPAAHQLIRQYARSRK